MLLYIKINLRIDSFSFQSYPPRIPLNFDSSRWMASDNRTDVFPRGNKMKATAPTRRHTHPLPTSRILNYAHQLVPSRSSSRCLRLFCRHNTRQNTITRIDSILSFIPPLHALVQPPAFQATTTTSSKRGCYYLSSTRRRRDFYRLRLIRYHLVVVLLLFFSALFLLSDEKQRSSSLIRYDRVVPCEFF